MKYLIIIFVAIVLAGCGKPKTPDISIYEAIARNDIKTINQHLASGTGINNTNIEKKFSDPNNGFLAGATPLLFALDQGNYKIIELLISEGADVNAKTDTGFTALMCSSVIADYQAVEVLIKSGASINTKGKYGFTALHCSVATPQDKLKKTLLKYNRKYTASHHRKVIEFLISNNANVNAQADNGMTPLDIAVSENPQVAGILIKHGAKKSKELKTKGE